MKNKTIDFSKLWILMDKMQKPYGYLSHNDTGICISTRTLSKMRKNESVTIETIEKICTLLSVDISDICETVEQINEE